MKKIYWTNRKDDWINKHNEKSISSHMMIQYIKKNINIDKILLDVGVGTGIYLNNLSEYKYIYGIDFIDDFINIAQKLKPLNCEVFTDDVISLKFNKYIDVIFTMTVLQHISHEYIDSAIKNLCNLNADDIIIFEIHKNTYNDKPIQETDNKYQYGHDYDIYFNKYNYKLIYKKIYDNKVNFLMHYRKINKL
jgi:2-polyprenyl-3-methyl-5-hydroxy-6-metoxy-1,4-benzoquinol methylase